MPDDPITLRYSAEDARLLRAAIDQLHAKAGIPLPEQMQEYVDTYGQLQILRARIDEQFENQFLASVEEEGL